MFAPYYSEYEKYTVNDTVLEDGRVVSYYGTLAGRGWGTGWGIGSKTETLKLMPSTNIAPGFNNGPIKIKGAKRQKEIWSEKKMRYKALIVAKDSILGVGLDKRNILKNDVLCALNLEDGKFLWKIELSSKAILDGIAVDREKRIYITLENGRLQAWK
jgi:hypothetical protein